MSSLNAAPAGWQLDPGDLEGDWRDRAACRGREVPRDWWFAEPSSGVPERRNGIASGNEVGIAHCAACPVTEQCLRVALTPARRIHETASYRVEIVEGCELGIFGGTTAGDRRGKTQADIPELLAMARARAVRLGLAPKRRNVQVKTETKYIVGATAGPGRGHKSPAAIYAERHGVSLPTARKRLRKALAA
jgi:hypothetical protein